MTEKVHDLKEIKQLLNEHKKELEENFYAASFFVFGSYARGEQTPESDIDILVELKKPIGLKFFKLEKFLEKIFGKKVDLGTPNSLKPYFKDKILKEAIKV